MRKYIFYRILILFACVLTLNVSFAQDKVITGIVSDPAGSALSNATVSAKGEKRSTTTDQNGAFRLTVSPNTKTLTISFVGMQSQDVSIEGRSNVLVTLQATDSKLNEVVVVGYGTRRRAEVSSSIASISEKDIKNMPVAGVDQALQGKVSGVTVTNNSGQPGGGVSIRVRGITSVNGNEPLYVVDGVPIMTGTNSVSHDQLAGKGGQTAQSVLATLNPNDIASVDILKDASAQAIYGSLAANGVVLITTKRGKVGEGKFSFDTYYGWQTIPNRLPVMNLSQYAEYYNSLIPEIQAAGGNLNQIGEFKNPSLLGAGTDWQDELFQTGGVQNYQLSFSGGQAKTNYYFSANYFDQKGTIIGSGFKRYSARFNLDQQVKTWLKAGISANLSRSNQEITLTDGVETPTAIVLYNSPATPVRGANGEFITTTNLGGNSFGNSLGNPIATALLRDVTAVQNKGYGNIYADIQFAKFLSLRNEVGFDFQSAENKAFQPFVVNTQTNQSILAPSKLVQDRNNNYYWTIRNYLTFNNNYGKHAVNAVVGHEAQRSRWDNQRVSATDLRQNYQSTGAGTIFISGTNGQLGDWAMESYFARTNYTFNNKYSFSGSIRRDAASSFGPNKRVGYFPAGSLGWTISSESFAQNWKAINYLKLRVGAGAVGNQNSPISNAYSANIRFIPTQPITGSGNFVTNLPNPDLTWESVVTYNAGVDATLLNRRLELSVDVYQKTTTDMILAVNLPVFSGVLVNSNAYGWNNVQPPVANAGEISNKGIDISLTSYNIQKKDLSWRTSVVFSRYKNKLVSLNSPSAVLPGEAQDFTAASVVSLTQAGRAVGTFYGYVTDGLFRNMSELNNGTDWGLPVGVTNIWLGDVRYRDIAGPGGKPDGKIDSYDVTFIGDPNPDFTYGITNAVQFKSFDLSVFLQGVYGNDIFNWTRKYTESMTNAYLNQSEEVMNRFTPSNTGANLPRYNQWNNNNLRNSDRFIEDGSYLRIQNVSLGYNVPAKWASKAKMTAARIYVSGQNLHTFTKYSGYDPEIGAFNKNVLTQNVDNGHYPNPRTITVGANIEF
jgi:TonB-linked SusC/RagA family outer membrane protein